jgi:hypothetical protein
MNQAMARRQLNVVALAEYINSCGPDHLHDSCPFPVETANGRCCQRQCDVQLRNLMTTPFDAGEAALQDGGLPNQDWRTVSLLRFCAEHIARNPLLTVSGGLGLQLSAHKSQVLTTSCLARLIERGIEADDVVRGSFGRLVMHGLVVTAAMAYADLATGAQTVPERQAFLGERLTSSIGRPTTFSDDPELLFRYAIQRVPGSDFEAVLFGWLHVAAPQAIALWWFPHTVESWEASPRNESLPELPSAVWLVDRLTKTYLNEWSTHSLHAELRWLQGVEDSPFPVAVMNERIVDHDLLVAEIALRAVRLEDRSTELAQLAVDAAIDQAVSLLAHGRPELAAALFESASLTLPQSHRADLDSRRAFCLIPCSPADAIELIVPTFGTQLDSALSRYNHSVACERLGDRDRARLSADDCFAMPDQDGCYMWVLAEDGEECRLVIGSVHTHARLLIERLNQSAI